MKAEVKNWGNFPVVEADFIQPDRLDHIKSFILNHEEVIARGNGRCYGDAALAAHILSTRSLDKFIGFDADKGEIEVEAGVLLSDILDFILPRGFFLPVTPGTKFITAGGALASDIHGKNHHKDGCFSDWVVSFVIIDHQGKEMTCSREQNSGLFWATAGGMGLTGLIISVRFRLHPVETSYIRQESIKAKNLDEIFALFEQSEHWTYTVAWIDCQQKGKHIGRSILMRGEHATVPELNEKQRQHPLRIFGKKLLTIPVYFPSFILNTWSIKLFNYLYYRKQWTTKKTFINNYNSFFYPLDAIHEWNKIYGKNGFIQYQFVFPIESSRAGMQEILECIAASGQGSFLAVLKLFGNANPQAYNSFPQKGYTLALDFKREKNLLSLVHQMDQIVLKYGGRIYRAKDSMSDPKLTDYLQNVSSGTFNSLQNKRIKEK